MSTAQEERIRWPETMGAAWSVLPRRPLLETVAPLLAAGGERPVVVFDDGCELSCATLLDRAERLAAGLARRGVAPGDRIALALGNRAEFLIAFLAILANRAVTVTLNPAIGFDDARHIVRDSHVVLALAEDEPAAVLERVRADAPELREVIRLDGPEPDGFGHVHDGEERIALDAVRADVCEMVDIGYTSGTTGLPKALGGDHAELIRYADNFLRARPLSTGDRLLCPLQYHYGDPIWMTLASLHAGTALVVMRRFSVSRFWTVARDHGVTMVLTIGAIPSLLLAAEPSAADRDHGVRLAIALAIPKDRHQELIDRFGCLWLETYGSSESGPAMGMPEQFAQRYVGTGAIGIPYPDVQARLVDEAGEVVEGAGSGELELSGEILFESYVDDEEATAEVLHGGWLRTGDLMRRDEDGVHYFLGRRKELIRRSGENVAPAEVEATLRLHPAVVDAAVVPVPDPLRGEEIKAYVELAPGDPTREQRLVEHCEARLAPYKVPRYVELRFEPFPRTPSHRIPKAQLKVDGEHRIDTAWDRRAALPTR